MPQRSARLQTLPFVILCGVLTDRSAAVLSAPQDREHIEALTRGVAALFASHRAHASITVATLGRAYPASQLTPPSPLVPLFAWHAMSLVCRTHLTANGPLPAQLPVVPHARLPLAPPATQADAQHITPGALRLCVVGIPCTLIGSFRMLGPIVTALTPLPTTDPAITVLCDLLRRQFAVAPEAVWPVAPVAVHEVRAQIQRVQHHARRWLAVQYARDHAPTVGGPLVAAQALYGTPAAIQVLSLVIQRADTLEEVKTHLFTLDDFPNGMSEVQRFVAHLCFVWGVRFRHTHAAVLPLRWDAHGQLQIFRLCAAHLNPFPADTLTGDRAH